MQCEDFTADVVFDIPGRTGRFAVRHTRLPLHRSHPELPDPRPPVDGPCETTPAPPPALRNRPAPIRRQLRPPDRLRGRIPALIRPPSLPHVRKVRPPQQADRHHRVSRHNVRVLCDARRVVLRVANLQLSRLRILQLYPVHGDVLQEYGADHREDRNLLIVLVVSGSSRAGYF